VTIPSTVDELTPEWFTDVLNTRVEEDELRRRFAPYVERFVR